MTKDALCTSGSYSLMIPAVILGNDPRKNIMAVGMERKKEIERNLNSFASVLILYYFFVFLFPPSCFSSPTPPLRGSEQRWTLRSRSVCWWTSTSPWGQWTVSTQSHSTGRFLERCRATFTCMYTHTDTHTHERAHTHAEMLCKYSSISAALSPLN